MHCLLSVKSQNHANMRHVTGTESYFENFLHVICWIYAKMQRKLIPEETYSLHETRSNAASKQHMMTGHYTIAHTIYNGKIKHHCNWQKKEFNLPRVNNKYFKFHFKINKIT